MPYINPYSISGLLIILTFFPLFFLTWTQGKTKAARYFSYHLLSVGLFGIVTVFIGASQNPDLSYKLLNFSYSISLFIPVFLLHSILAMTNKSVRRILTLIYGQAIFFMIATYAGIMFHSIKYMFNSLYYNQGGTLFLISVIIWLTIVGGGHVLLLKNYRGTHPDKKIQASMLMLAIPFGFGGGITNYLPALGVEFYPIGNFLIPIYSCI